jgi:phospho-N-acetylmuramoyl-pentapeptide-transferase
VVVPLGGHFRVLAYLVIAGGRQRGEPDRRPGRSAIVPVMIAAATFGLIAYLTGNANFARYPADPLRAGCRELAVICGR